MTNALPPHSGSAAPLFEHIAAWGEISSYEGRELFAGGWLAVLVEAGVLVDELNENRNQVGWRLTPEFMFLLDRDGAQVARNVCFAVPAYRAYLVGVLAEGLVDAALASMTAELEEWTGDLPSNSSLS